MDEFKIMTLEQWLYHPYSPPNKKVSGKAAGLKGKVEEMKQSRIQGLAKYLDVTPTTIRNFARSSHLPSKGKRGMIADYCNEPILWRDGKNFLITFNNKD